MLLGHEDREINLGDQPEGSLPRESGLGGGQIWGSIQKAKETPREDAEGMSDRKGWDWDSWHLRVTGGGAAWTQWRMVLRNLKVQAAEMASGYPVMGRPCGSRRGLASVVGLVRNKEVPGDGPEGCSRRNGEEVIWAVFQSRNLQE